MATQYPSNRSSDVQPGIRRSSAPRQPRTGYGASSGYRTGNSRGGSVGGSRGSAAGRPGARPAAGTRQGSGRYGYDNGYNRQPAQRTSSQTRRPPQGRPTGGSGQRPPQNRRRRPPRRRNSLGILAALAAIAVLLVVVLVVVKPFGRKRGDVVAANVGGVETRSGDDGTFTGDGSISQEEIDDGSLVQALANEDARVGSLSSADMAQVKDLRINTSLPEDWLNVLLLGTDERVLNDSARTDSMMICSINMKTGEVKLSSIQRDLDVQLDGIGKYSGNYRINAANYFGGPKLAMRTVNENFGMNIQYYVMVNFFGFQRIAQQLGGIDIDISKEEMEQINVWAKDAYRSAHIDGVDVSDLEYALLKKYGEKTHLNGTQTLAYARIRKLDGGDYARSERQRKVLAKLAEKVKTKNALEIAALATSLFGQVKTNLKIDDIINTTMLVAGNGIENIKSLRLPVPGSYAEDRRNDDARLWDCDFAGNATQLYNFIYEQ